MPAKLKLLPPMDSMTIRTLWVAAKFWSISAWPWCPLLSLKKSMPGLKLPLESKKVDVLAPEQAKFTLPTPQQIWISADFERWHPGICSAVPVALSK